jgi:hypothetical protein
MARCFLDPGLFILNHLDLYTICADATNNSLFLEEMQAIGRLKL